MNKIRGKKNSIREEKVLGYCKNMADNINDLWIKSLRKKGVSYEDVEDLKNEVISKTEDRLLETNRKCLNYSLNFFKHLNKEQKRSDFFGRAIIESRFFKYFPKTSAEEVKILRQPLKGLIPSLISASMIVCVKSALGMLVLSNIESRFEEIVNQCKNKENLITDWDSFFSDKRVLDIVDETYLRLKELFKNKDYEKKKEWLNNMLSNTGTFNRINRPFSEDEYKIMITALFE